MKTYLQAWWRGIGVVGLYICLSIVVVAGVFLVETLPEGTRVVVGFPLFILIVPPLLAWALRWLYPELAAAKSRFSKERQQA